MSMEKHVILNTVDTPLKILFWTMPELLMGVFPPIVGLLCHHLTLGILGSVLCGVVAKQYRVHFGKGQWEAVRYWFLPDNPRFKALPLSYVREYLG
ncbi:MAG: type IV conjugative transfer system protein TraL [Gammaproteobacteria bacterium]|nr:type IV conjugative transfer system protein TraL [Gammaproteobacteria bacterium]MBP9728827.1 type IV conjugative transfer system protein TraL [Gammaproteobacteria bacterium]